MSDVAAISSTGTSYQDPRIVSKSLTSDDFVKIMVTQLSQQDPFKAQDTNAMMQNFMSMGNFQAIQEMTTNMKLVQEQQAGLLAESLVGRTVEITKNDGSLVSGVVASAKATDSDVTVTIGSASYSSKDITSILNPVPAT